MKEQVLNIKQMQELIALGVDTSKASMIWNPHGFMNKIEYELKIYDDNIHRIVDNKLGKLSKELAVFNLVPTFTLHDILEIIKKNVLEKDLSLDLELNLINNQFQLTKEVDYSLYTSDGKTLLQSAFQMLKWCKQNNYI